MKASPDWSPSRLHSHDPYPRDGEGGEADGQDDPGSHRADGQRAVSGAWASAGSEGTRGRAGLGDSAMVIVNVTDVNDNVPVFQRATYSAHVPESLTPGNAVLQVHSHTLIHTH